MFTRPLLGLLLLTSVALAQAPVPTTAAPSSSPNSTKPKFPPVPANVLFRPTFLTADIAHFSGIAFRLHHESGDYLVTAQSLFTRAAGLDLDMTPEQVARVVVAAVGVSTMDPSVFVLARPYMFLPGARAADDKGSDMDIALFKVANPLQAPSLALDPAPPFKGDKVWILVKYFATARTGLEAANIAWVSENEIRYLLTDQEADLRLATGAPILSEDGHVVGMHIGTFKAQSGRIFGFGCPGPALKRALNLVSKK